MGAFFSLRKTVGCMILAAAASYLVMRLHSIYLEVCPEGQYSEMFFAVQTILLVLQCIGGLILVGVSLFYTPSGAGIMCAVMKIFLVLAMTGLAVLGIWLVAQFGSVNATAPVNALAFMIIMNT